MQGWGRKRSSRRQCPPRIRVQLPRPCLDSLEIPTLRPCPLPGPPRKEFVPSCVQPSCGVKHPICHCVDKNYCTPETCTNSKSCMKSHNLFCSYGIKGAIDEDSDCNRPCREQVGGERNYVEDYEKVESSCNEMTCEEPKNCGVGASSNDEELIHPVAYIPSVTNQNALNRNPLVVPSRQVSFDNNNARDINNINDPPLSTIGFTGRLKTPNSINFSEASKLSNVNRSIQINMQNKTVTKRGRDAESSVAPAVCSGGNEVPNSFSLSGLSQCNSSNVDKISLPERYETTAQPYKRPTKTSESHLNTGVFNLDDNGGNYFSLHDQNNSNHNKSTLNSCCKNNYDHPASLEPKSQEQVNYSENGKKYFDFQRTIELPITKPQKQNFKIFSAQYEHHDKGNTINETPMKCAPQRSPGINTDGLHIRDESQHILPQENVLSNTHYVKKNSINELSNRSQFGNNSTNQKRFLNENQNQLMSTTPYDCCKSGVSNRHSNSFESPSQKPRHIMSPSCINTQATRSSTKPPLINNTSKQFSGSQLNQFTFHDNNHINGATYSPIKNQNPNCKTLSQSSKMQINDSCFKDMNDKKQPTNNASFDQKFGVICEGYKQGCYSHNAREKANKKELLMYKPTSDIDCVCFSDKNKQINGPPLDLKDIRCEKKPTCVIEDGTTSCASTTCIINQSLGCNCRYPPAFKQFSCTGNISGICNCNDKK